jgi:hypothetical protein
MGGYAAAVTLPSLERTRMSIAITEDHRTLADVTADFLERHT